MFKFIQIVLYHIHMIINSPSKNLNLQNEAFNFEKTSPYFASETIKIINKIKLLKLKEIKSLGKFRVKISLHSEIDAEIHIVVESAEAIQ